MSTGTPYSDGGPGPGEARLPSAELEPSEILMRHLRERFFDAHRRQTLTAEVLILNDSHTFDGLALEHMVIYPNVGEPTESWVDFHEAGEGEPPTPVEDHTFAMRGLALALEQGGDEDSRIFPLIESRSPYRLMRVVDQAERNRVLATSPIRMEDLDHGVHPERAQGIRESSRFIMMAAPDRLPYPEVYYIVDEHGITPMFGARDEDIINTALAALIDADEAATSVLDAPDTDDIVQRQRDEVTELVIDMSRNYHIGPPISRMDFQIPAAGY